MVDTKVSPEELAPLESVAVEDRESLQGGASSIEAAFGDNSPYM